jgi:hypothetical protein
VGVCRSPGFSSICAFQEYIYKVGVAEVGGLITSKLTPTLCQNERRIKMIKLRPNLFMWVLFVGVPILVTLIESNSLLNRKLDFAGNYKNLDIILKIYLPSFISFFMAFCILPHWYFFIDNKGIGSRIGIGFGPFVFFKIGGQFPWGTITCVDYMQTPILKGLFLNGKIYIALFAITNKRKAIRIFLDKLPRQYATEEAEKWFYRKWEKKLGMKPIENKTA